MCNIELNATLEGEQLFSCEIDTEQVLNSLLEVSDVAEKIVERKLNIGFATVAPTNASIIQVTLPYEPVVLYAYSDVAISSRVNNVVTSFSVSNHNNKSNLYQKSYSSYLFAARTGQTPNYSHIAENNVVLSTKKNNNAYDTTIGLHAGLYFNQGQYKLAYLYYED